MISQRNALIVIVLSLTIPLLFWLSAAVAALLILRYGAKDAFTIVIWGALPAFGWLAFNDAVPLLTFIGASLLAVILRASVDLKIATMSAAALGVIFYAVIPLLMPEAIALVQTRSEEFLVKTLAEQPELLAIYQPIVHSLMLGVLAMISALVSMLCLLLARWWQASFFNPDGFKQEFHQLKLPVAYALIVVLLFILGEQAPELIVGLTPVIAMPFMIAGVALVHGIVGIKQLGGQWLTVFYLSALFFGPYLFTLLIFVALLDSLVNIRSRLTPVVSTDENQD